VNSVILI